MSKIVRMAIELERSLRDYFIAASQSQSTPTFKVNLRTWVLTNLMDLAEDQLGVSYEDFNGGDNVKSSNKRNEGNNKRKVSSTDRVG